MLRDNKMVYVFILIYKLGESNMWNLIVDEVIGGK